MKNGLPSQYALLDEAIKTGQFVRNKCIRYWMDNKEFTRNDLQKLCSVLPKNKETPWVNKLNSQARQSSADRALKKIKGMRVSGHFTFKILIFLITQVPRHTHSLNSSFCLAVQRFYPNCRENKPGKKGFPKFKKHSRSVEYKQTGYKLSSDPRQITFRDGFRAGTFELWCSKKTLIYYSNQLLKRVRVVKKADGYYCQFLIDYERKEHHESTGKITGIDVGLKEFYTDAQGNTVENPRYLRKAEKRFKKAQSRLSKKHLQGLKQSIIITKKIPKIAKLHLKVSRQRKDLAIKTAKALIQSNHLVVYEALKIRNLVKNHKLAKSIRDASWDQFTQWVDYYARIYQIVCVSVPHLFTSQDCSVCGTRVEKTLSTRTHQCPNCKTILDRDHNAAINILKKGLQYLGIYLSPEIQKDIMLHTVTNPKACGESDHWFFNCEIEELSRLVEAGICNSDVQRIPRHNL